VAQPVPMQLFLETSIEVETRMAVVTEVRGRADGPAADPSSTRPSSPICATWAPSFGRRVPQGGRPVDIGTTEVADPYVERLLGASLPDLAHSSSRWRRSSRPSRSRCCRWSTRTTWHRRPHWRSVRVTPDPALRTHPQGVSFRPGSSCAACSATEDQTNCRFRTATRWVAADRDGGGGLIGLARRRRGPRSARPRHHQGGDPAGACAPRRCGRSPSSRWIG